MLSLSSACVLILVFVNLATSTPISVYCLVELSASGLAPPTDPGFINPLYLLCDVSLFVCAYSLNAFYAACMCMIWQ